MAIKKSVTNTQVTVEYDYEEIVKLKTKMVISGASVEACDEAYHSLNSEWINEVSYSFTEYFIDKLRGWCGRFSERSIVDADLELCNFEPEPLVVYCVEYCDFNEAEQFKLFKTKKEAEQFADEYLIECMDEKIFADMKERGLTPRAYVDARTTHSFAYAFIVEHKL